MNVAEIVGKTLAELGVAQAFGVVGSGNFDVTNALRAHGVPFVATRHEAGAATMADAYGRMSGRVALVSLHQGCGLTNAMTGITEAAKARTPMIVLTADTPGSAVLANFRIDQDSAVIAVGATSERVHSAETAVADTVRAYRTAVHERRTVVLNLPLDVQAAPAVPATFSPVEPLLPMRPNRKAVEDLAAMIEQAQRPVFIAGRGARGAAKELRELAAKTGALLATTAVAHGLFHDDPWSLGISGGFSSSLAADLITEADLVVGWGSAFTKWTTRRGKLLTGTTAQVDIGGQAHQPVDLVVQGDAGQTAQDVTELVTVREGYRSDSVQSRLAAGPGWPVPDLSTDTHIDPRELTARLDELLPRDRLVSVDSGNFMGYPSAYLSVPDEFGYCMTQSFQSIGLGLFTAIGAALARPDRLPVAAVGDGGFMMSIAELETVVRLKLPMVIVVYNDSAYGAEIHHFGHDADLSTVVFPDPGIAEIARGFGCAALTVHGVGDLDGVAEWVDGPRDRPLLIDAKIASDGGSWWLAEAFG
ncbi:thiamine pyrophosphate-binding protein [Kibdelosporangium philippinense]|uniref:Thiamine pyrophosphate-binding protein n=1 Tax=Kibdelosporangium philippinense TaxID=211113 RepID=A0ABS8ZWN8_9PSEU|nr:thiamine pyrophosphate-binding protein [Kibdelosporangium philippinense]MCE7012140.1 thiamine pyrophosphate-binding protein [Kibdelosporangium philippinense]